jgi:hypothetical protein
MELRLIKEERNEIMTEEEVKFSFYKNIIKKDLELACWCNNAVRVFGDFQIYSDHRAELNSFEQMVSFITGRNVFIQENTLEVYVSSQCSEYFLNMLILKETKLNPSDVENLSIKFTKYILEALSCLNLNEEEASDMIRELDKQYFGASDLGIYKKFNKYSH